MEKYSFFNSINGDRKYDATSISDFFKTFFTNGVFDNGLKVKANTGMTIEIEPGQAFCNGHRYENTDILTKEISIADGEQSRIDNVVIRVDETNRTFLLDIIQGEYASNPVAPNLERSSTIYDLRIAKISVPAGATEITDDMITDCRFDSNDCGNVVGAVQQINTTDLFKQYETAFNNWFSNLETQLSGDVAGNLQNQINDCITYTVIETISDTE